MSVYMPRDRFVGTCNYLGMDHQNKIVGDILLGLSHPRKSLPSKYFYDSYGSKLFEKICDTPEYYLTRTELSIIDLSAHRIMSFFSKERGDLVELGSGSSRKIGKLLKAVSPSELERIRYIPVDISESALQESVDMLSKTHRGLDVLGIVADFTTCLEILPDGRKLITFFGSTIGNFTEEESKGFLGGVAKLMSPSDRLLVGIDMLKPIEIMQAAYNDTQGITGKFNLNILTNINRDLGADFNLDDFEHLAFFNEEKEQIEMHLRARRSTTVLIADMLMFVAIDEGETIRTEICRKFSRESASRMFQDAGLTAGGWFTDPKGWFSLVELKRANQ